MPVFKTKLELYHFIFLVKEIKNKILLRKYQKNNVSRLKLYRGKYVTIRARMLLVALIFCSKFIHYDQV